MVHALQEASRVVVPAGLILDLRPMSATYPLELVTAAAAVPAGEIPAYGAAESDQACEEAVQHALRSGWFKVTASTRFELEFYCDNDAELRSELEGYRRTKQARMNYAEIESRRRDLQARIRFRRPTMLDVYRKT